MKAGRHLLLLFILIVIPVCIAGSGQQQQRTEDKEALGRAMDYFKDGKYGEALSLLTRLDKRYKLSPRIMGYIGICHYYEWNYKDAAKYLDSVMPQLEVFAPGERNMYYFACAESHFNTQEYAKALPMYEKMLNVCSENEKGDAYYKTGFCNLITSGMYEEGDSLYERYRLLAYENFTSSLQYYQMFNTANVSSARITQLRKMINGLTKPELFLENDHTDSITADTVAISETGSIAISVTDSVTNIK